MSRKREPMDEEMDFGERSINKENEARLASLTHSISQLKSSAIYLNDRVEEDGKNIDAMVCSMSVK